MSAYLLAFDLGTTGNKAILVDPSDARVVASATVPYPTHYTGNGGAEQSPDDWWASTVQCCQELRQKAPAQFAQIAAVGAGGMMNGLVLTDQEGHALHPAIIHADLRAVATTRELERKVGVGAIFDATSNRPDLHLTLPKAMWVSRDHRRLVEKASFIVQAKDYLVGRLTGVAGVTDPSDASLTGGFDVRRRQWVTDLWETAGVPVRLLPEVVPSTRVVGNITAHASGQTGIKAGVPVVMGGGDGACASAGSGVPTGQQYNYLGGTSWIGLVLDAPLVDDRLSAYCALDERVTAFGTVQAAGSSVEWIGRVLGIPSAEFADMDSAAEAVGPGAGNLFFLPYLQGERAPLWDDSARGVFFGLASSHTRAHLFRAVIEGVCYALGTIMDVFAQNGHGRYPIPSVRVLGGGAQSPLWRSILAAVYQRPLSRVTDSSCATSLGAAMAAGVGVGLFPSIAEAARLVAVDDLEEINGPLLAAYAPRYQFFQTLYPALKDCFHELAAKSPMWPPFERKGRASGQEDRI